MGLKQSKEKDLFNLRKAVYLSELIFEYHKCFHDWDIIRGFHILIKSRQVASTYFIPGNNINNSFDRLWMHRATNQIKINLTRIKENNQ